jgi:TonB family protein
LLAQAASNPTPIVPEARVSVRAQLLQRGVANYPPAARQAEVEADVDLEVVMDEHGRVLEARVVKPFGYGFDAAAVQAVRAYKFSPALVDGKAVRVRMRWSVQFRLQ